MGRISEQQLRSFAAMDAIKAPARVTRTADGYRLSVELSAKARAAFAAMVRGDEADSELVWHTKMGEPRLWADLNLLVSKLDEIMPGVDLLLVRREVRVPKSRRNAAQPEGDDDVEADE